MAKSILSDFPSGPLTSYRNKASFDWKKMKLTIYEEEYLQILNDIWKYLKYQKCFVAKPTTIEEKRYFAVERVKCLRSIPYKSKTLLNSPDLAVAWCEAVTSLDSAIGIKYILAHSMFIDIIRCLGTEKHKKYINAANDGIINGCIALAEMGHNTCAKSIKTTATYDHNTKEFVLKTPGFEAAKCWVHSLGQFATHMILFARLITADETDHGVHAFVVPVRSVKNLRTYAKITIGDLGPKIGLDGIDSGYIMFNSYRIPKDNLLNRIFNIDDDGNYISHIKDPREKYYIQCEAFSGSKVFIAGIAVNNLQKAITIAIRYSAVRKYIEPEDFGKVLPIIEHPQQQFCLMPYIAVTYTLKLYYRWLSQVLTKNAKQDFMDAENRDTRSAQCIEIHALSSALKVYASWMAKDCIQTSREACGNHGYIQASQLGDIRNDNDALCTMEGENHLLLQDASIWLIGLWKQLLKCEKIDTPYGSVEFFNWLDETFPMQSRVQSKTDAVEPAASVLAYRWLIFYVLKLSNDKMEVLSQYGLEDMEVHNHLQAYYTNSLSLIFIEYCILHFNHIVMLRMKDDKCRQVFRKLISLYGAWSIEKHLSFLYMGGYFTRSEGQLLREGIVWLCECIAEEAVSLVDVLAPPDFVLDSVLGMSDGDVYKHLEQHLFSFADKFNRPTWWKKVLKNDQHSKL